MKRIALAVMLSMWAMPGLVMANDGIEDAIEIVLKVSAEGEGHVEAVKAMKELNSAAKSDIPALLVGLDRANNLNANWLRGAIVSASQKDGDFPTDEVMEYFKNSDHSHMGRLTAFELLSENDDSFADKTIPTLADDVSLPLRRMGIDWYLEQAKSNADAPMKAMGFLGIALDKARDVDQVEETAKLLGDYGIQVDLQKQLGFLNTWKIVGSFDNKDEKGFDVAYGPELDLAKIDLEAEYENNEGEQAGWKEHSTVDTTATVDLTKVVGPIKGVSAYAYTTFTAEEDCECEVRVGSSNAHKVWVNGELAMANEVYHNGGISVDKFASPSKLKKGENIILVKISQNEQTEPWAQAWDFQIRICDKTGKAIQPAKVEKPAY